MKKITILFLFPLFCHAQSYINLETGISQQHLQVTANFGYEHNFFLAEAGAKLPFTTKKLVNVLYIAPGIQRTVGSFTGAAFTGVGYCFGMLKQDRYVHGSDTTILTAGDGKNHIGIYLAARLSYSYFFVQVTKADKAWFGAGMKFAF